MKYVKKLTTLLATFTLLMSLCIIPASAADELTASFTGHIVISSEDPWAAEMKSVDVTSTSKIQVRNTSSSKYRAYAAFNLSDLESKLNGTALSDYLANVASVTLSVKQGQATGAFAVGLYGLANSDKSVYTAANTAFPQESYTGMEKVDCGTLSGTDRTVVTAEVTDYVKSQTDGKLVFFFDRIENVDARFQANTFKLIFSTVDEANVAEVKKSISLEEIYYENFTLPTTGEHGAAISWESDNTAVAVEGANATVTRGAEDIVVTLKATITVGTATDTLEIKVTVPKAEAGDVYTTVSTADTYVRKNNGDTTYSEKGFFSINGSGNYNLVRFSQPDWKADEVVNAKLYLYYTGKEKAADATIMLYGMNGEDKTAWEEETVTYNILKDALIATEESKENHIFSGFLANADTPAGWFSYDVTDYVKAQADGVYSFFFKGTAADARLHTRENTGFEPYLELTKGDVGAVRTDTAKLELPSNVFFEAFDVAETGANGSAVSWEAEPADAVTFESGKAVPNVTEDTNVVLKATITKGEETEVKTFDVKLVPSRFTFNLSGTEISEIDATMIGSQLTMGIRADINTIPDGTKLYIAKYKSNGKLDTLGVYDAAAQINWSIDEDTERMAIFLWTNDSLPLDWANIYKKVE